MVVLSHDHERFGNLLGRMIEMMTVELDIPCEGAGSTTWRKKAEEQGLGVGDVEVDQRGASVAQEGAQGRLEVRQVGVETTEPVRHRFPADAYRPGA